jgi:TonB-dependent Receptor Plug Domain
VHFPPSAGAVCQFGPTPANRALAIWPHADAKSTRRLSDAVAWSYMNCFEQLTRELMRHVLSVACCLLVALVVSPAYAQNATESQNLSDVSIEDLMNVTVQVTSASKKTENLSQAPAAIFVITGEDLRRGGFSSIPDALRMVPGLHVAQQNAHIWVVSARGFSSLFNNKMLVLIDGRLVYSPEFGGVWWDVQDPPLEDIDRIEVIRGPGGTLWGANAVNGGSTLLPRKRSRPKASKLWARRELMKVTQHGCATVAKQLTTFLIESTAPAITGCLPMITPAAITTTLGVFPKAVYAWTGALRTPIPSALMEQDTPEEFMTLVWTTIPLLSL